MREQANLKPIAFVLAALVFFVAGLYGQPAEASEGGGGDGGESQDVQSAPAQRADPNSPPPGFIALTRAFSAFQRNSLFMSPEEATARFLLDLTYGPLIEMLVGLSFQQQFGQTQEPPKAPIESKETPPKAPNFFSLGQGLSVLERIQLNSRLSGILGRKDALLTEKEGGLPFWIYEESCEGNKNGTTSATPAPPSITWESDEAPEDSGGKKKTPAAGKAAAGECKDDEIKEAERRAVDFLGQEYFELQKKFGTEAGRSKERQKKLRGDAIRRASQGRN